MNKYRPTVERIKWTTTALNHVIGIQQEVDNLQIKKEEREAGFVIGTQRDVNIIYEHIIANLGTSMEEIDIGRNYDPGFWYFDDVDRQLSQDLPSDKLELAFSEVPNWRSKHAELWDANAPNNEEVWEEEVDSDSGDDNENSGDDF